MGAKNRNRSSPSKANVQGHRNGGGEQHIQSNSVQQYLTIVVGLLALVLAALHHEEISGLLTAVRSSSKGVGTVEDSHNTAASTHTNTVLHLQHGAWSQI